MWYIRSRGGELLSRFLFPKPPYCSLILSRPYFHALSLRLNMQRRPRNEDLSFARGFQVLTDSRVGLAVDACLALSS